MTGDGIFLKFESPKSYQSNEPKNPFLTDFFLVEVEVASTVIGNPYVDLAPPDCTGDGWSGDAFGEDVGFILRLRLTAHAQDKSFVTYQGSTTVWKLRKPPGVWSPEAEKEASSPLIFTTISGGILPVVEKFEYIILITLQLFLQTRKIGSLYINFFNQRECFYKKTSSKHSGF